MRRDGIRHGMRGGDGIELDIGDVAWLGDDGMDDGDVSLMIQLFRTLPSNYNHLQKKTDESLLRWQRCEALQILSYPTITHNATIVITIITC